MRILVADKDASVLSLVQTRLSARGYDVIEASSTEEALRFLSREAVDLILMSTDMERQNGRPMVECIRRNPHLTTVPVIMMTEEDNLAELVMGQERGFDDFLIKPFNAFVLQLRVSLNIRKTQDKVEANALTHLPGNHAIERVIRKKVDAGEKFSVLYLDINRFKSFNDLYGFDKGDDVIRHTAKLLVQKTKEAARGVDSFVGHIGGDDFVVVIDPACEEPLARSFLAEFDRIIATYYNEADKKRGYVRVTNRQGKRESVPLMSCSVAACNNLHRAYQNLGEIAQDAAEVKSFLKSQQGSHYLRDRRSEPIQQVEQAVEILAPEMNAKKKRKKANESVDPLGQVLMDAGLISEDQLSQALKKHFQTGQRLGQVLIAMDAVSSEDVGHMLEKRLHVPYVSLKEANPGKDVLRTFTVEFMKSHRVIPLDLSGNELLLGMCDPFDLRTLDEVERITSFKPAPRLALEDEFEIFIEKRCGETFPEEKIG